MLRRADKAEKYLYLIGLAAGLVLFAHQAQLSLIALYKHEIHIPWKAVFLSLGISICFYFIQMASWTLIMKYFKAPVGIVQALQGYALSFLPRYIPGSIWGYWGRSQWLKQSLGISYKVSFLGSITEAAAFVITAFIIGVGFWANTNNKFALRSESATFVFVIFIIFVSCWLFWGFIVKAALDKMSDGKQRQRLVRVPVLGFAFRWFSLLLPYAVFWMLYGIAVAVIAQTITPFKRLATIIACAAMAWVVGFIIVIIPSGLGIRETMLATLLNLTMGFPASQGNLVGVIFRAVNLFAEFIWLLIGLCIYTLSKCQK
jgi:uncharacterized membrane protein YbhN (UPF0104 family)